MILPFDGLGLLHDIESDLSFFVTVMFTGGSGTEKQKTRRLHLLTKEFFAIGHKPYNGRSYEKDFFNRD